MPKVKFDREEIINTTFDLLKNDGIRGISKLLFKLGFIKQNQSYDLAVS